MITASHNPPEDNGFKVLDATGAKLNSQARKKLVLEPPGDSPQALPAFESDGAAFYTEQLCRLLGPISPCLVVVDCANGAARQTAPMALKALGLQVKSIYTGDGAAINQHCGALYPQALAAQLGSADFGIALDGDGDRGILILPGGQILDGDDLLFLIASRLPEGAGCVGTIMSNGGLEQSLYAHRQRFFRAPVGDAYVAERMRQEGALLGGEPSGHLLFFGEGGLPTADGLVACLLAIQALQSGVRLDWQRLPQENRSVRVDPARIDMLKPEILALEQAGARVVVRASGTEPVVRVMVEHPQQELAKACVERLCGLLNP
jgi:phosphoglucosamine mutase